MFVEGREEPTKDEAQPAYPIRTNSLLNPRAPLTSLFLRTATTVAIAAPADTPAPTAAPKKVDTSTASTQPRLALERTTATRMRGITPRPAERPLPPTTAVRRRCLAPGIFPPTSVTGRATAS